MNYIKGCRFNICVLSPPVGYYYVVFFPWLSRDSCCSSYLLLFFRKQNNLKLIKPACACLFAGDDSLATMLRILTAVELFQKRETYAAHPHFTNVLLSEEVTLPDQSAVFIACCSTTTTHPDNTATIEDLARSTTVNKEWVV